MKKRALMLGFLLVTAGLLTFPVRVKAAAINSGSPEDQSAAMEAMQMMPFMPMPGSQMMFSYPPVAEPVMGSGAQDTMPIGVGTVASGGNTVTMHATVGIFRAPMDMYFALYAPALDPLNIYLLTSDGSLQPVAMGMVPWASGVTYVDHSPFGSFPTTSLPNGVYSVGVMATPAGNLSAYYFWMTSFVIQH